MSLRTQFKCCSTFSLLSCSSKRTFSAINVVRNKNGGKADCQNHYTLPTKKMLLGFGDGLSIYLRQANPSSSCLRTLLPNPGAGVEMFR
jgi:hypothetical protein